MCSIRDVIIKTQLEANKYKGDLYRTEIVRTYARCGRPRIGKIGTLGPEQPQS